MVTRNEIKVELTGVHLCCQGCVNAAEPHSLVGLEDSTVLVTKVLLAPPSEK